MQLVDRIEKRRFVGREFLLWLWFESELYDATLRTREHGPFGLWLERRLVLSEGKESTRITAPMPGVGREAKEALLRGQLPESAGIRVAWNDEETSFVLKAEALAVSALKLKTALGKDEQGPNKLLEEMMGGPKGKRPKGRSEPDDHYEVFYERMGLTSDFEQLLEALYRDFLRLRLDAAWRETVVPLMRLWVDGKEFELDAYDAIRRAATEPPPLSGEIALSGVSAPEAASAGEAAAASHDEVPASVAVAAEAPPPERVVPSPSLEASVAEAEVGAEGGDGAEAAQTGLYPQLEELTQPAPEELEQAASAE